MSQPEPRSFHASLLAMLGIGLVIVLIAIDSTVVGTAMPRIVAELRGYDLYAWIASAYLMTSAVAIPIAGRLGDLYGRKPFVLAATVLFTLASGACGLAQSMMQLMLARGLQGLGGGMLVGVAFACVPDLFPDRVQRVRWQVILSASFGVANAIGPGLGGWLTEHAGWRSVFYVNLPIAVVALGMVWRYLPSIVQHEGEDRSIDWLGALLLTIAICGLLLGTERAQAGGFGLLTLGMMGFASACGAFFIWHQYHTKAPIVPPDLLNNSGVRKLIALGVLTGTTMFALIFYAPLLLQGGFGHSPKEAGLVMTPLLVCITLGSIINGRILPHLKRAERLISWGLVGTLASCLALSLLSPQMPKIWAMVAFGLCGISLGFQLPNLTLQMHAVAGARNLGAGTALVQSTRMLGSMIGVAFAGALVNTTFTHYTQAALAAAHQGDVRLAQLLSTPQVLIRAEDQSALHALGQQLGTQTAPLLEAARQGLIGGIHMAFLACAAIAAVSICIGLRLPRYELSKNR